MSDGCGGPSRHFSVVSYMSRRRPSARLTTLVQTLGISLDEAEFILSAAEHDAFDGGYEPDPIHESNVVEILQRMDSGHERNLQLARMLARSGDVNTSAMASHILSLNRRSELSSAMSTRQ